MSAVIISGAILYSSVAAQPQAAAQKGEANALAQAHPNADIKITDSDPVLGNPNAPVTLVAFEDFECPFCERFTKQTEPQLLQNEIKSGKAKLVWKDFPLSIHSHTEKAHEAARCVWEQGKFWEYHDILFNNQSRLGVSDLKQYARNLNLDESKFANCLDSGKYASLVQEKVNEGQALGVNGTPSFFINGAILVGAQPYQTFASAIARAAQ